jgi:hypothetical protein
MGDASLFCRASMSKVQVLLPPPSVKVVGEKEGTSHHPAKKIVQYCPGRPRNRSKVGVQYGTCFLGHGSRSYVFAPYENNLEFIGSRTTHHAPQGFKSEVRYFYVESCAYVDRGS